MKAEAGTDLQPGAYRFGFVPVAERVSLRYGIWRCTPATRRGTVVLLGGRSEFMEKYCETIGELKQHGFDVFSFDWRGQGLSSRLLADRHKGFVRSYDDYIADLDAFVQTVALPQAKPPLVFLAHSMGAHVTLRYLDIRPGLVSGAVLVSPLIDICAPALLRRVARIVSRSAQALGLGEAYVIGAGGYLPENDVFEVNRLTSDPKRFLDQQKAIQQNPQLALGGVTYGWLAATFASIDVIRHPAFARRIDVPILMVAAAQDRIVCLQAQQAIAARLPRCTLTVIPSARHEILNETDAVRAVFWQGFDRFTGKPNRP